MPKPGWRDDPEVESPDPRYWCQILSPEGHKHCDKPYFCGCPCHLPGDQKETAKWRKRRRPRIEHAAAWVAGKRY